MGLFSSPKALCPDTALPGRAEPIRIDRPHAVFGLNLNPPYPSGSDMIDLGMGCFWGAERLFWQLPGVVLTAVGYAGGYSPNPHYREVCTGATGHSEVVRVVFDPDTLSVEQLLVAFWQAHDPTQGMRQGNDVGSQYRSVIYCQSDDQLQRAVRSRDAYQQALVAGGVAATITTELALAGPFYFAEDEHQQYLHKQPGGYCGLRGTGVSCPVPVEAAP